VNDDRTIIRRRSSRPPAPPKEEKLWRCRNDNVVLGEFEADCVVIRDHRVNVTAQGRVTRVCHKCNTQNVIIYPPPQPAAHPQ